jgi:hypothetical protein
MLPVENAKEGQHFIVYEGEHVGAIVRLLKTKHDVYGGITKPPKVLYRGAEIACPWAKLRRVTLYTLFASWSMRVGRFVIPLVKRYIFGTIKYALSRDFLLYNVRIRL